MNVIDIPYVKLTGIEQKEDNLSLDLKDNVLNHIQTIHAAAQFTLAETQSGLYLEKTFPEFLDKVLSLLREANIKFKKPAVQTISAEASVSEENLDKFTTQFEKKGRATIQIDVIIKDINNITTSQGTFTWFIQKI